MDLTLILPAFNEEALIADAVRAVDDYLADLGLGTYEILVGDDGSTDATAERARSAGRAAVRVLSFPHAGKGGVLSSTMLESRGRIVGFLDADLEIAPTYVGECLARLRDGYDIAIASKTLNPEFARQRTLKRRAATRGYNLLVRLLFGSRLHDHQAGLKVFDGELIRSLVPRVRNAGWLWDTEVLVLARAAGARVAEVAVTTVPRPGEPGSVASMTWEMFRSLLALRWRIGAGGPRGDDESRPVSAGAAARS
ncbi:MAG TPA: glycosyltransferase [Longimicrobiales bacterium]|nr:glycosyltransferase [Longimicrobiales bacterium]